MALCNGIERILSPRRGLDHLKMGVKMKTFANLPVVASTAFALSLAFLSNAAQAADPGITSTSIKIGMIGSLTGPAAPWGWPTINGARMVYDAVNAAGGIHGRKIEVVVEDSQCTAALALAGAKKLIHRDNVFMIHGGSCSGSILPVREDILSNKVPMMVLVATIDQLVQKKPNDYIFRAFLPGSYDGTIMADFLATVPNVKKVVVVGHSDEHASARYGTLRDGLKKHGLELLGLETVETQLTDATAQVLKIKSMAPDAVVIVARPAPGAVFLKDAYRLGLNVPMVGATVVDLQDLIDRVGDTKPLENTHVVSFYKAPLTEAPMAPWIEMLKKYYPNDKVQASALYGTSGALAVVEALKRAGPDLTREKFVAAMREIKNMDGGPMACKVTFSADDHEGCKTGSVWGIRAGKIVVMGDAWKK